MSKSQNVTRAGNQTFRRARILGAAWLCSLLAACHQPATSTPTPALSGSPATLAQVYFWRARPGKLDEYTRYIRDVAAPIDEEARKTGAFISVTTYMATDTLVPWTHMRVFLLKDSAQLRGLGAALNDAGVRVQPDSVKRRQQSEYSATLRDRVGAEIATIVR